MNHISIEISGLTRQFGDLVAIDHVSLAINKAEIFGLIGPNGAGKSTLIKMLTTLLPPTSGSALVAGHDIVQNSKDVRRSIGYVPQLLSADGTLTGYENMLLSARLYGLRKGERGLRIANALARMGLSDSANHLVSHYSGGMIRRLEIAQSLLHLPAVLFLDEPTVGLDPAARETVWRHVLDLRENSKTTIMVASHNMTEMDEFCDRIALINKGKVVAVGTPTELKRKSGRKATMDDVFIKLVGARTENETENSYGDVKQSRRAAREHG